MDSSALVLEEHLTDTHGKQGHLKIVRLHATAESINPNGEISRARWAAADLTDLPDNATVSKWVHSALKQHHRGLS
ncbi:hypothetical protein Ais01nite_84820 [Asanoa ishikariensis]|nr:hypothetical protein Ais01nite_84820 [Asanoa ishikariensis]